MVLPGQITPLISFQNVHPIIEEKDRAIALGAAYLLFALDREGLLNVKPVLIKSISANCASELLNNIAAYLVSFPEWKPEVLNRLEKTGTYLKVTFYNDVKYYNEEIWHDLLRKWEQDLNFDKIKGYIKREELGPSLFRGFLKLYFRECNLQNSLCRLMEKLIDDSNERIQNFSRNLFETAINDTTPN
jgi:hypothetical protein